MRTMMIRLLVNTISGLFRGAILSAVFSCIIWILGKLLGMHVLVPFRSFFLVWGCMFLGFAGVTLLIQATILFFHAMAVLRYSGMWADRVSLSDISEAIAEYDLQKEEGHQTWHAVKFEGWLMSKRLGRARFSSL